MKNVFPCQRINCVFALQRKKKCERVSSKVPTFIKCKEKCEMFDTMLLEEFGMDVSMISMLHVDAKILLVKKYKYRKIIFTNINVSDWQLYAKIDY